MLKLMKNKFLVIICGDPNSTFNEILIKTLKNKVSKKLKFSIVIVCSKKLFENELKKLRFKIKLQNYENQNGLMKNNIYIFDVPINYKTSSLIKKNVYIKRSFEIIENRIFLT